MSLIKPFFVALIFSSFIYLEYFFGVNSFLEFINTLFAVVAIGYILTFKPKELFWVGFFIGIFWFYWIALSFRFYDLIYLIPLAILVIGSIYGAFFLVLALFENYFLRAGIFVFLFSLIEPFGFNWFKPELMFVNSFFDNYLHFYIIVFLIASFLSLEKLKKDFNSLKYGYIALISILIGAIFYVNFKYPIQESKETSLKIYLADTNLSQEIKWDRDFLNEIVQNNLDIIDRAIDLEYDLVVLPESAFPVFLSEEPLIREILKEKSESIDIHAGALRFDGTNFFNSSFLFSKGNMEVADKVELVPFGEKIPLPSFISSFINSIFFDGATDYATSDKPTDFNMTKEVFRNAICFEGTIEKMYIDAPDFFLLTSNNAWFTPSIEPVLQRIFLRYFAKKYGKTIYHSSNYSKSEVIFAN